MARSPVIMGAHVSKEIKRIVYSERLEEILARLKKKNQPVFQQTLRQIDKILREPAIGKPLRYTLKNRRRVHVGSFVLIYEFRNGELRFLDFDHHDNIYKK